VPGARERRTHEHFLGSALREVAMPRKLGDWMQAKRQRGGMGYVLLWLLGVPIPVLILIWLLRGCT
jgi:hypothetical protein